LVGNPFQPAPHIAPGAAAVAVPVIAPVIAPVVAAAVAIPAAAPGVNISEIVQANKRQLEIRDRVVSTANNFDELSPPLAYAFYPVFVSYRGQISK
jgi:hypothetical protein